MRKSTETVDADLFLNLFYAEARARNLLMLLANRAFKTILTLKQYGIIPDTPYFDGQVIVKMPFDRKCDWDAKIFEDHFPRLEKKNWTELKEYLKAIQKKKTSDHDILEHCHKGLIYLLFANHLTELTTLALLNRIDLNGAHFQGIIKHSPIHLDYAINEGIQDLPSWTLSLTIKTAEAIGYWTAKLETKRTNKANAAAEKEIRLEELKAILKVNPKRTTTNLSKDLGVSRRQVYRYLLEIRKEENIT